jgi:hypothetical protein
MNLNRNLPAPCSAIRMAHFGLSLATALLLRAACLPAAAQPTNSQGRPDFSAFKLITDRNIFDPHRSPRIGPRSTRDQSRRSARTEYVALVGIMTYDGQGPIAFFDGTSSQYQKVLKPAESIAGYKVTRIEPTYVKLAVGSNEFQLPLGMQLRRDSEGKWQLAEATEASPDKSDRSSVPRTAPQPPGPRPPPPTLVTNGEPQAVAADTDSQPVASDAQAEVSGTGAPPDAAPGGGETDPVLLRLMQRRAQEAGQ